MDVMFCAQLALHVLLSLLDCLKNSAIPWRVLALDFAPGIHVLATLTLH